MAPTVTKVAAARNTADFDLKVHTILWTSPYERSNYPRNRGGGNLWKKASDWVLSDWVNH